MVRPFPEMEIELARTGPVRERAVLRSAIMTVREAGIIRLLGTPPMRAGVAARKTCEAQEATASSIALQSTSPELAWFRAGTPYYADQNQRSARAWTFKR